MRPIVTKLPKIEWTKKEPVESPFPILKLPDELTYSILSYLSMKELGDAALTCKIFLLETSKMVEAAFKNCPYNPHLVPDTTPKEKMDLLLRIKAVNLFMYKKIPTKDAVHSYLLNQTSDYIFTSLQLKDPTPLAKANALALDHLTPWPLLNPSNCGHITHIELDSQWLQKGFTRNELMKIRTCFPNLNSCSFKIAKTLNFNQTPLHLLSQYGLTQLLKLAIAAGADVHAKDGDGNTPLHDAVALKHKASAIELIKAGAIVNAQNNDGDTPLHEASFMGRTGTVRKLIKAGAIVNLKNHCGDTPLHLSAYRRRTKTAKALIAAGAQVNAINNDRYVPLVIAIKCQRTETAIALIKAGAETNIKDKYNQTPLHWAAAMGQTKTALELIAAGADVDDKDNEGCTTLDTAINLQRTEPTTALINAGIHNTENDDHTPIR